MKEEEEERRRKQSLDSPQTIEANNNINVCNSYDNIGIVHRLIQEHNRHECMLHNGQQNESADFFLLTIQNPIMYVGTYL